MCENAIPFFLILWIRVDELFAFMSRFNLYETMKDYVATGFIDSVKNNNQEEIEKLMK